MRIAKRADDTTWNAIRHVVNKRGMEMHMKYCRQIYTSYLRAKKVDSEVINLLQGRIEKSIFVRHYNRPDMDKVFANVQEVIECMTDAHRLAVQYVEGKIEKQGVYNREVAAATDDAERLLHLLIGGCHQTIYGGTALEMALDAAGFVNAHWKNFDKFDSPLLTTTTHDMFPELSLIVEAQKPLGTSDQGTERPWQGYDPLAGQGDVVVVQNSTAKVTATMEEGEKPTTEGAKPDKLQRIALISTPFLRTPPSPYGGSELVVANLGRELAKRH